MSENQTLDVIIGRLPQKPLLTPREIADACGLASTSAILDGIRNGSLQAVVFGKRIMIARDSAITFLNKRTY